MSRPPSSRLASASIEGTLLVWSINSSNSGQARRRDERTSMPLVIAVDLGGTKIRVGTVETDSGLVRVHDEIPTPSHAHLIVSSVVRAVRELMERDSGAIAVGIASAGVIDTDTGTVVSAGPTIPGWAGTLLGARVSNATGLRTLVMNDVHATALGELAYGALVGLEAGLVVSVGTGVGSAATLGRRVACGQHGLAGTGSRIESVASGPSMTRAYNRLASSPASDFREVIRRVELGDASARDVILEGGRALGCWLGPQIDLIDPALVLLAGGVTRGGPVWLDAVAEAAQSSVDPRLSAVALSPTQLGDHAPLLGAALRSVEEMQGVDGRGTPPLKTSGPWRDRAGHPQIQDLH
jgi:glucokinase